RAGGVSPRKKFSRGSTAVPILQRTRGTSAQGGGARDVHPDGNAADGGALAAGRRNGKQGALGSACGREGWIVGVVAKHLVRAVLRPKLESRDKVLHSQRWNVQASSLWHGHNPWLPVHR